MSGVEEGTSRRAELGAVTAGVAVVGGLVRWWVRNGAAPLRWNDSADYLASAHTGWSTSERWLGPRPVLMPAALSAVSSRLQPFIDLQLVVAALAWALLALAVASGLPGGWRRWVAAVGVLGLSAAGPLVMWDQQVLTESLAISALVVAAAAVTWAAQGIDRRRAVALVAAIVVLLLARDSHVIPVMAGAAGLAAWGPVRRLVRRSPSPEPPFRSRVRGLRLLTAGYLVAFAFVAAGAAASGQRELQPLEHVYAVRVLPYPDRLEWFAAHGMPDAGGLAMIPLAAAPGKAPFVPLAPSAWSDWRAWLARSGRATFARYVAAHPGYVLDETRRDPERVFNNGDGISTYRPVSLRAVPLVTGTFWPSVPSTLLVGLVGLAAAIWRRVERSPLVIAGVVLVVTAAPHALVVWHSDGMESARHLLIPGAQLRVGTLLLVLAAALAIAPETSPPGDPTCPEAPAAIPSPT